MGAELFMFLAGAMLMRLGLAIINLGAVRSRNASATFARHVLDLAVATLAIWLVSFIHPGKAREIGLFTLFALAMLVGSMHIGATSERSRLWPMLILSAITAGVTLPLAIVIVRKWLWSMEYTDQGLGFVHLIGATTAAVAVKFVGPREGKYHRDGSTSTIPGHNLPMEMVGAVVFVIGTLLLVATPMVLLAVAASVVACAAYCQKVFSKIDLPLLAASMVAGAVAVSPGAGALPEWAVFFVGLAMGLLTPVLIVKIDMVLKIDDVTGAITMHGVAAIVGLLAAIRFRTPDGDVTFRYIGAQLTAIVVMMLLAGVVSGCALALLRALKLRSKDADEFDGLDIAEHDTAGYPDFQQNSIR